jgi:hypothetical protein
VISRLLGYRRVDDLNPEVAMFDDEPVGVETQERHTREILATAVDEPGPGAPPNRGRIAVDDRSPELAVRRLLFVEDASEIARLGIAERILLPEGIDGVERSDGVQIVLTPTAFPDVSPPLRGLPRIHDTKSKYSEFRCPQRGGPAATIRRSSSNQPGNSSMDVIHQVAPAASNDATDAVGGGPGLTTMSKLSREPRR